jgi:predicted phage-related endonuclease
MTTMPSDWDPNREGPQYEPEERPAKAPPVGGLTDEQIAIRRTGITATDVVVLAGLSPHKSSSAHTVWAEKRGLEVQPLRGDRLALGHELEPIILRRLAARRDLTLLKGGTVRSRLWATHIATPDAFHTPRGTSQAVAEAKAVGFGFASNWGEDDTEVPDHVFAQVQWQMHVCALDLAYVGALIGTEVRTYVVPLDLETVGALVETADQFWTDHVKTGKPPAIDGSEGAGRMLRGLFPRQRGPTVKASADAETAARRYFGAKQDVDEAGARVEEARQLLMVACGEAEGLKGDGWRLLWKHVEAREVTPKPYTLAASRRFDMRKVAGR